MSVRAIVVDDERLARSRLSRMLLEQGVEVVGEGEDGEQAVELVKQHQADMLFIDINMPKMNGLDAVLEIGEQVSDPPSIVFCTAYDEYALEAFKANASAYLLKPVNAEELTSVVQRAAQLNRMQLAAVKQHLQQHLQPNLAQSSMNSTTIRVGTQGSITNIPVQEIISFQSIGKHCYAKHCEQGDILVDYTLKDLESKFAQSFVRSHRSTLVNTAYLAKLVRDETGKSSILLSSGGETLPVSRRHLSQVKKWFE